MSSFAVERNDETHMQIDAGVGIDVCVVGRRCHPCVFVPAVRDTHVTTSRSPVQVPNKLASRHHARVVQSKSKMWTGLPVSAPRWGSNRLMLGSGHATKPVDTHVRYWCLVYRTTYMPP